MPWCDSVPAQWIAFQMSKQAHEGIQALQQSEKDVMDGIIDQAKKNIQDSQAFA
jgi:hypothetical protein